MLLLPATTHPIPSRPEPSKRSKLRINLLVFDLDPPLFSVAGASWPLFSSLPAHAPLQPGSSVCVPGSRAAHLHISIGHSHPAIAPCSSPAWKTWSHWVAPARSGLVGSEEWIHWGRRRSQSPNRVQGVLDGNGRRNHPLHNNSCTARQLPSQAGALDFMGSAVFGDPIFCLPTL